MPSQSRPSTHFDNLNIRRISSERAVPQMRHAGIGDSLKITVITPVLNRADWIESCIESVNAQGYENIEHIVVDGGSNDGTLDIVKSFPSVKLVAGPDRNSHHAINKGLAVSTGDVVGVLGSDDVYSPGAFAAIAAHFVDDPSCAVIRGACYLEDARGDLFEILHEDRDDFYWAEILYGAPAFNSWFFRRSLLERFNGLDESYLIAADREFLVRLSLAGIRAQNVTFPLCRYRAHPGSATLSRQNVKRSVLLLREHIEIAAANSGEFENDEWALLEDWRVYESWRLLLILLKRFRLVSAVALMLSLISQPEFVRRLSSAKSYRAQYLRRYRNDDT
jgi:glycosyltransferase involved in cell wall biosynthesis